MHGTTLPSHYLRNVSMIMAHQICTHLPSKGQSILVHSPSNSYNSGKLLAAPILTRKKAFDIARQMNMHINALFYPKYIGYLNNPSLWAS